MSLKTDYFDGLTGLHSNLNNAFDAGVALIGTGVTEISSLDLGDRNGSNIGAGSGIAGVYLDIDGPGAGYRFWMYVSGEIAPSSAGRTLVQVTVASGATRAQLAGNINDAINALSGSPFETQMIGDSIQIETSGPKTIANPIALSSGWGLAVASVVQVGSDATGNYSTIRSALLENASEGSTTFTVTVTATLNPTALRANKGNNLLLKAYLAGIQKGLSDQQLYDYEVAPALNVTDTITTSIDLNFTFQVT